MIHTIALSVLAFADGNQLEIGLGYGYLVLDNVLGLLLLIALKSVAIYSILT